MSGLAFLQLALNTSDMPGSLRLYSEVFGFSYSGAMPGWGELMDIQELDESARMLMCWMVGGQPNFQLEIFQHTVPQPKPLPDDWTPQAIGWGRFGVRVPDFDHAVASLESWNIPFLAPLTSSADGRRVAFRDPFVGAVVEVLEGSPSEGGPVIAYVARSVSDLPAAWHFFVDMLGLALQPSDALHSEADEQLWGVDAAGREGFVVKAGDTFIEVFQYSGSGASGIAPRGIADQGIMNVGLGHIDVSVVEAALDKIVAEGRKPRAVLSGDNLVAIYITDADREVELLSIPPVMHDALGFNARPHFDFEMVRRG